MTRDQKGALHLAAIMGVTIIALAMAALLGAVLPATDVAFGADAAGEARKYTDEQILGRKIYVREGCFTCHTQMVRDAASDVPLGPMSSIGNYGNEAPSLIGLDRIGPDLMCAADRIKTRDEAVRHLRNPRSVHDGSSMPSYAFLSTRELQALASYLMALQCEGGEG
jgi:cytochrome c oxidase cbb3-type subunit 2